MGGKRSTPMTGDAAARMQSTADRKSDSRTAKTGAKPRAQSAAARNAAKSGKGNGGKRR